MEREKRIKALIAWGEGIKGFSIDQKASFFDQVQNQNNWFTPEQSEFALSGILHYLSPEQLIPWAESYEIPVRPNPLKIGLIMAGNLPGVGFHDLLCCLVAGHAAYIKTSSSDAVFLPRLVEILCQMFPEFQDFIHFSERLKDMDAYIATGSDNSARYFDYYFGKYPNIIRKNRSSVAILDGKETSDDWDLLSLDIFQYYGLGCRNVSKLYLPDKNQLQEFMGKMGPGQKAIEHHKYLNNYDYNKAIYLINKTPHLDNGHLLLTENTGLVSPISVVFYEVYANPKQLEDMLADKKDKIQCILSREGWYKDSIPFGKAQCPDVNDYADKVDTLAFLLKLNG